MTNYLFLSKPIVNRTVLLKGLLAKFWKQLDVLSYTIFPLNFHGYVKCASDTIRLNLHVFFNSVLDAVYGTYTVQEFYVVQNRDKSQTSEAAPKRGVQSSLSVRNVS